MNTSRFAFKVAMLATVAPFGFLNYIALVSFLESVFSGKNMLGGEWEESGGLALFYLTAASGAPLFVLLILWFFKLLFSIKICWASFFLLGSAGISYFLVAVSHSSFYWAIAFSVVHFIAVASGIMKLTRPESGA